MTQHECAPPVASTTEHADAGCRPHVDTRFPDAATFSEFLRNHREGRKISLRQIADRTRISVQHLSALERGDIRHWPGGIYRRSMIRAYATAIGLDAYDIAREFARVFNDRDTSDDILLHLAEYHKPQRARVRRWLSALIARCSASITARSSAVIVSTGAGALLIVAVWYASSGALDSGVSVDVAAARPVSEVTTEATVGSEAPAIARTVDPASKRIITSGASAAIEQPHAPVTRAQPATVDGELVVTSNPAGARVTVNGIGWGRTPLTVRYLPLGDKRVRISKDGYVSAEQRVQLTRDRPSRTLRLDLKARDTADAVIRTSGAR